MGPCGCLHHHHYLRCRLRSGKSRQVIACKSAVFWHSWKVTIFLQPSTMPNLYHHEFPSRGEWGTVLCCSASFELWWIIIIICKEQGLVRDGKYLHESSVISLAIHASYVICFPFSLLVILGLAMGGIMKWVWVQCAHSAACVLLFKCHQNINLRLWGRLLGLGGPVALKGGTNSRNLFNRTKNACSSDPCRLVETLEVNLVFPTFTPTLFFYYLLPP